MSRDVLTLSRHVLQQFEGFTTEAQDFSALMTRIALAGKMIARRLSQSGLVEDALGVTGSINVQGEVQQQMDDYANRAFIRVLEQTGLVCRIVSEEMTAPARLPENCSLSRYALVFDPLDGSSNIDANLAVGSIFSVLRAMGSDETHNKDLLQPGHQQIAAGYIMYGPSTQLVYTLGKGVHSFTLDPSLGEFILSKSHIRTPQRGSVYSLNEGYFCQWQTGIQDYVKFVHRHDGYTSRYSGALVADFHRILLQGGVYLYPGTQHKPEGKLRLMYEASPLAFLMEQAGGVATDGEQRILDIHPHALHQRVPLIIGSSDNVAEVERCLRQVSSS
ncbi:MAG: class 1 fructose-bisphosphatase [Cyanobacteriota bacterium]|nr:class 1 fructose-bisphosphatase [Cyanobacteriota bacterium]